MTGRAGLIVRQANPADARRGRNVRVILLADLPWRSVRLQQKRRNPQNGLVGKTKKLMAVW
jgi:hypothetical protein